MSGLNAERSDEFVTADSRLDAILDQLNALGGAGSTNRAPDRPLRSIPPVVEAAEMHVETAQEEPDQLPEQSVPHERPATPELTLVPPPVAPVMNPEPHTTTEHATQVVPPPVPVDVPTELVPPPVEAAVPPVPEVVVESALTEPESVAPQVESDDEQSLVFELDAALDAEHPATPSVLDDSDAGWVSHETSTVLSDATTEPTEVAEVAEETPFAEPDWSDLIEDDAPVETPVVELSVGASSEVEHLDLDETVQAVPELGSTEATEDPEANESIPKLDFTGVWADTTDPSVWQDDPSLMGALPEPIEGNGFGGGVAVGRTDLDSLRPDEEQAAVKQDKQLSRKLQFLAVMLFGLIALAVVLLNDPRAVEELRAIYDGFFG